MIAHVTLSVRPNFVFKAVGFSRSSLCLPHSDRPSGTPPKEYLHTPTGPSPDKRASRKLGIRLFSTKKLPMKNAFFVISIAILVTAPLISGQRNDISRYPFLVHGDLPLYPALAKSARISGTVHVRVTVENGEVVGYVQPSGNPCSFLPQSTTSSPGNSTRLSERLLQRPSYINLRWRVKEQLIRLIPSLNWSYHHWPKSQQDSLCLSVTTAAMPSANRA
jgi:hypothetical protein